MNNNNEQANGNQQFPQSHFKKLWMGLGIAIFSGLGVPISIIAGNFAFIGIGPAIGVAVGASIGMAIEKKKESQGLIRPLTDAEKKQRKALSIIGTIVLLAGMTAFFLLLLLR